MVPFELAQLQVLMERTSGSSEVAIGLIDGPVSMQHPGLASENFREIPGANAACMSSSTACKHGTFVAGIMSGKRNSSAPGICPGCILLIRPIFPEDSTSSDRVPSATPLELASAINQCIDAGARVINLSLAVARPSIRREQPLEEALNRAASRNVLVVAAAGNQGTLGSTAITRHPWVIPVVACDLRGVPLSESNLGSSIGRRGLCAPGDSVSSWSPEGEPLTLSGTSVAAPLVTGTIALLWSEFPAATAAQVRLAVSSSGQSRRASVVPPLLNGAVAYNTLLAASARRIA